MTDTEIALFILSCFELVLIVILAYILDKFIGHVVGIEIRHLAEDENKRKIAENIDKLAKECKVPVYSDTTKYKMGRQYSKK
jgi:hypothetical protein